MFKNVKMQIGLGRGIINFFREIATAFRSFGDLNPHPPPASDQKTVVVGKQSPQAAPKETRGNETQNPKDRNNLMRLAPSGCALWGWNRFTVQQQAEQNRTHRREGGRKAKPPKLALIPLLIIHLCSMMQTKRTQHAKAE